MKTFTIYSKAFFCTVLFIICSSLYRYCSAQSYNISTYAGIIVDSVYAISTELNTPEGIAIDAPGNVYIADVGNQRIRKVKLNGIIITIAGTGAYGYAGDGGPATSAELYDPTDVALDAAGNIYIADEVNNRIRKVNTGGIISTIAGNGTAGYSGDGGQATNAELYYPTGIALDTSGNIYIADYINCRIRKVLTTGIISTIAGQGTAGYSGDGGSAKVAELKYPWGVTPDASGNVYIADEQNYRVRKVNSAGIISTIAGNGTAGYSGDGGAAVTAELDDPARVAEDASGNIYIADLINSRVRMINTSGIISTFAGIDTLGFSGDGGQATNAELHYPSDVKVSASGNFYVADEENFRIRMINKAGIISTIAGNGLAGYSSGSYCGDGGAATAACMSWPNDIAWDTAGNAYIADALNNRVRMVTTGGIISTIAGNGIYGFSGDGGAATAAELNEPYGVMPDAGNLYIADGNNNRIRMMNTKGLISTVAGNGKAGYSGDGGAATLAELNTPISISFDVAGNVYIGDAANNCIRKINTGGIISTYAGNGVAGFYGDGGAATAAELNSVQAAILDASGNVYIADALNNRIRKVNTSGIISTLAGNGVVGFSGDGGAATAAELYEPDGILIDVSGNVFIADWYNNRIRMVNASGIISTIAGNGIGGYYGDGGMATAAELNGPGEISMDATGNIYIPENYNNTVRKLTSVPLAIKQLTFNCGQVAVFPNPSNGRFTIQWIVDSGQWMDNKNTIEIYNVFGQKVFSQLSIVNYQLSINISNQPDGVYFFRVENKNGEGKGDVLAGQGKIIIVR